MKIVPTVLFAALLAGPVHAQVCSGGAAGGIDATGNQCNNVEESTAASGIDSPAPSEKMSGVHVAVPAATAPRHSANQFADPQVVLGAAA